MKGLPCYTMQLPAPALVQHAGMCAWKWTVLQCTCADARALMRCADTHVY